jgi:peptidoglycan/LPS O-acetylase OafA/YrhL
LAALLFSARLLGFDSGSLFYLKAIESNSWIFGVFGLGYQYLNKPGTMLSYLSQAAYPVYIIHMFVLFGAALVILPMNLPPLLKFALVSVFTFVACFAIYEFIIRRIRILRPLFGLKNKTITIQNTLETDHASQLIK